MFRKPSRNIDYNLNLKIDGKKLSPSKCVKYLDIYLDSHLNWNDQVSEIASKLTRANRMLAKIRHYVSYHTLIRIYYGIFSSHLTYGCQVWGQKSNSMNIERISTLQNKALKIIHFSAFGAPATPLYKTSEILKLKDYIYLQNVLFAHDYTKNNLPKCLQNNFNYAKNTHLYNTRICSKTLLDIPLVNTSSYGKLSITFQSVRSWNNYQKIKKNFDLSKMSKTSCKKAITLHILNKY